MRLGQVLPWGLLVLPVFVFAQTAPSVGANITQPDTFSDLVDILLGIIELLIPVLIALALVTFFWGLVKFVGSAGNEEAVRTGKALMIWGIIGLFVMVSIWGILGFLSEILYN